LVVDDSEITQEILTLHLNSSGYDVTCTSDGLKAIEVTRKWCPSVILLDLMMPVMDGFGTMRRIREFSSVPIVIVSAKSAEVDKVQGLNGGADDYLVKPFSSEELMARLRAVLRRYGNQDHSENYYRIFQHGDLLIDVKNARVKVDGKEIILTTTEYNLLVTLASSMGKTLSHEYLLSKVWGSDYQSLNSIIDASITKLHEKIERNPQSPIHIISCGQEGYFMPKEGA
jgi:DNA-binding response OmpR family regulator